MNDPDMDGREAARKLYGAPDITDQNDSDSMPNSKRKGSRFEREITRTAEDHGLSAQRAFASDGRSLGEAKSVDVIAEGSEEDVLNRFRIQAKRRASVASYLAPPEGADATVIREDYGDSLLVMPLESFLDLVTE